MGIKFVAIADLHIGRPRAFMSHFDHFLFPTKEGVGGKLLEDRLAQSIEKINKDKSLDFVVVLGDYSEGDPKRSFEFLDNIRHSMIVMKGNHDPQTVKPGDPIIGDDYFLKNRCGFIFLKTTANMMSHNYFSEIPKGSLDFLRQSICKAQQEKMEMSVIFSHSPIFSRIIKSNPKKIVSDFQKNMRVVNIAGHFHTSSEHSWNNGMIRQIVLDALFCHPSVYKFTIDGSKLSFELI